MSLTRLISSKAVTSCIHQAAIRPFSVSVMKLDQVTHTGQQFDEADQRNARFAVTGLKKEVNTQWAVDLIAAIPPTVVTKRVVSCDGGGGALGHPKIYINLDQSGPQSCNYCGLRFELDHAHH
eukprot:TRINITY_DN5722_c0_g1_i6.p1 TRINITY_DN5722_c0_g1~~TRINITY_DN5722_c0_g1_i6.p1  ORF type:complete len:133 (-),score=31.08 TRINITY_DN5722_c0_g1_i6:104-472(-)